MKFVQQPRILVVDDEYVIALTLAAILREEGYEAEPFPDPLAALCRARSSAPDLLLTDIAMPQMSGIDLAIQVRMDCPDCRILLFSGQASTLDQLTDARRRGYSFDLLLKPAQPDLILKTIRSLLSTPQPSSGCSAAQVRP